MYGKCFFCGEDDYAVLDCHRILPGTKGGTYSSDLNSLILCANCHRKVHSGAILVDKKYMSTAGIVVHYFEDGKEYFELD